MTADMAFECLLVSRDPSVVCPMNKILEKLSIFTEVCFTTDKAADRLVKGGTDLIIVDWEERTTELLQKIRKPERQQRPTIVAVAPIDQLAPMAHFKIAKPITGESCTRSLRIAYSWMLRDHRRSARYALMTQVIAQGQKHSSLPITIMDIGDGGAGLMTKGVLAIGDTLSFRLSLPGVDRAIYMEVRILWTREYGSVGCEFLRIPPVDLSILHDWLKSKCRVKQPLVQV